MVEVVGPRVGGGAQLRKPRSIRWTVKLETQFLEVLAATCNVSAGARAIGVSTGAAYERKRRHAPFASAWAAALAQGYDQLELAMLERVTNGTRKPVFRAGGEQVGELTEYDNRAAFALLKLHREEVRGPEARDVRVDERERMIADLDDRIALIRERLSEAAGEDPEPAPDAAA